MTPSPSAQRVVTSLLSSLVTTAILTGGLWMQHARGGWPFAAAPPVGPAPPAHDMAAMETGTTTPLGPDARTSVNVTAGMAQALGIQLEPVRRETLTQTVQAVATVALDESRISHVHTRVAGWVEQLDVNTTGETVRAGQPLARVFSQELLSSQTEYLAARRATTASGISSAVVASGRTRLGVLGMTPEEIDAIEASGEPRRLVTLVAPRNGIVVNRGVTVGTAVDPSTPLLTVADLSTVWILAEVPEAYIPTMRVGMAATLDFPASGRTPFPARVDFVYPTLTERTRTLRVRLNVLNTRGMLRPGLYGTATFASTGLPTLTVPRDAVVDTGREQHVFILAGDRFEPRPVTLGVQLADRVEVRSGLAVGEQVVAAGVFLLDSESRLRATGAVGSHVHGDPSATRDGPLPVEPPTAPEATSPAASPPAVTPHAGHGG